MAQRGDVFRRYLEAGMAFTEMTRSRAEEIVRDLVKSGEISRTRAEEYIEDLVQRSRQNTEAVVTIVQAQLREQLGQLGFATKEDIARLEARIDAAGAGRAPAPRPAATPAKATAKKLVVPPAPVGSSTKKAAVKKSAAAKKASGTKKA